jgi:glycosyltransferase involved in cell wall biosynthesis
MEAQPRVLVYGPFQPPEVACGISSAVRAFAGSRVREHYALEYISTFRAPRSRSLPERLAWGAWLVVRTLAQALRAGAAIVDVHAVSDRSLLSHAAILFGARLAGRPALLRIHGGDFDRVFEQAGGAHRALIRLILRAASRVVVLSEGWRGRLLAIEPLARIAVVPNSVDCRAIEAAAARAPRPRRRVLFLANFAERKGHFDALQALARLAPRYPDLRLVLGGEDRDPGTRSRLEREAAGLGVGHQLEFLGTVSGAAKDREFSAADVLILPSHTENMPVSVIEGMAAGLPVVATRVGALGEMIEDGRTGLLIPPRDPAALAAALERLFEDPAFATRLAEGGRRHARATWDAEVVAARNLELYAELLGASGGLHAAR